MQKCCFNFPSTQLQIKQKDCTSPRLVQIRAEALDKGQQLEHIGAPVTNDPNTLNPPTLCPNIR